MRNLHASIAIGKMRSYLHRTSSSQLYRNLVACFEGICLWTAIVFLSTHHGLAKEPNISGLSWKGPAQIVFDSEAAGCERIDIPDQSARAFRDFTGQVHLFATHYVARAMVGPSLDQVKHECHIVYRSLEDADPSHFQDRSWLYSFYTEDGKKIVALLHTEYEAWTHPGRCKRPEAGWPALANCWWNSITMSTSTDGGNNFVALPPPSNLVASPPYPYSSDTTDGTIGYQQPTNILKFGNHYYAMILDWPFRAQKFGPCLIRTSNPFDAGSWRAWDGTGFSIQFINPYTDHGFQPEDHVCTPVGAPEIYLPGSLSVNREGNIFLAVEFTGNTRLGPPGLYIATSSDLTHWSRPSLLATTEAMQSEEPPGRWDYGYFSLLDPTAPDRNFATVSDAPYVYYVRFDRIHGNFSRTLMRRQVEFHLGN